MAKHKLFVGPDNKVTVRCPDCFNSKIVSLKSLFPRKHMVKVRCQCGTAFSIDLEFRKTSRKNTDLQGFYQVPTAENEWGRLPDLSLQTHLRRVNCTIRNISMNGLGFTTLSNSSIKVGDALTVKFILDATADIKIEKNIIVRSVQDNYVGCEFVEAERPDATLGFHTMDF